MAFGANAFVSEIQNQGVLHLNRFLVSFGNIPGLAASQNINLKERLTMRAEAVRLPTAVFANADSIGPRAGYGPIESIPYGVVFDEIPITFSVDGHAEVHRFFYEWTNLIVNYRAQGQRYNSVSSINNAKAYEVEYKDNYVTDIEIRIYEPHCKVEENIDEYIMRVKLYRAHPRLLPTLDMSWEDRNQYARFTVPFVYTDFEVFHKYNYNGKGIKPQQ